MFHLANHEGNYFLHHQKAYALWQLQELNCGEEEKKFMP